MSTLYTGKGDGGTTKFFPPKADQPRAGGQERVSKASPVAEALGTLDELNSFLGLVRVKSEDGEIKDALLKVQENLFTVQAHVAGADKNLTEEKVKEVEKIIAKCEEELPPIKTFTIPGGTELGAMLDYARTIARRAERRVVEVRDGADKCVACSRSEREIRDQHTCPPQKPSVEILKYLNRLSSLLFALARLTNHKSGIKEDAPSYN